MDGEMTNKGRCGCPHHSFVAYLVILLAVVFLLKAYGVLSEGFVDVAWPVLVGAGGFSMLGSKKCKCCQVESK